MPGTLEHYFRRNKDVGGVQDIVVVDCSIENFISVEAVACGVGKESLMKF